MAAVTSQGKWLTQQSFPSDTLSLCLIVCLYVYLGETEYMTAKPMMELNQSFRAGFSLTAKKRHDE